MKIKQQQKIQFIVSAMGHIKLANVNVIGIWKGEGKKQFMGQRKTK